MISKLSISILVLFLNFESKAQLPYSDSAIISKEADTLTSDFYKDRYQAFSLMDKVVNGYGNGDTNLYGTRNVRPTLHGISYRGGSNNYFHKTAKRKNQNPMPNDGLINLCQEGFSKIVYLYRQNFETAPSSIDCNCINGQRNTLEYYQLDYDDDTAVYEMLKMTYQSAKNDEQGPVYLHCWNGWHASGFIAAITLRQFCGYTAEEAINYWDIGTDGMNKSPNYRILRTRIKNFIPYPEFTLQDSSGNSICPPMPEIIDSNKIHIEAEHIALVPESIPIGREIILYDIRFASGEYTLNQMDTLQDIKYLLKAFKDYPSLKLEIGGYTDNVGSPSKNKELSSKRAKFVYDFFIKKGVSKNQITYKGYGKENPKFSNRGRIGRSRNRRIEVKLVDFDKTSINLKKN